MPCLLFPYSSEQEHDFEAVLVDVSQSLHQATLAAVSEITRGASEQELENAISPKFSTVTLIVQSSIAACGTSGC